MKATNGFAACIKTNIKDIVQNVARICGIINIIIGVANAQNTGHVLHRRFVHNHGLHGSL